MNRRASIAGFVAATIVALLVVPAHSQDVTGGKKHRGQQQKPEGGKKKTDDSAYKAALDRIPVPEKKYDPWQNVRSTAGH